MKYSLSILIVVFFCINAFSKEKKKKPPVQFEVTQNGKTHLVSVGDTVQLGFGSSPYGGFLFLEYGAGQALQSEVGGKKAVITKIQYFKSLDTYRVMMKTKVYQFLSDKFQQAIVKKEIVGINQTKFE